MEQPPRLDGLGCAHPDDQRHQGGEAVRVRQQGQGQGSAEQVGKLLDLAPDDVTRRKSGDLIAAAKRGAPLAAVEDVRRRLGLGLEPGQPGMTMSEWLDGWLKSKARTPAGIDGAWLRTAHQALHRPDDR